MTILKPRSGVRAVRVPVLRGSPLWAVVVLAGATAPMLGLASGASASATTPAALTVYVHPGGTGAGRGTRSSPYTSLAAARDALRPRLASLHGNAVVELEGGTYALARPFILTAADSGRPGHQVIYQAAPGAHPVLSGGIRVTGWRRQPGRHGIWAASVPAWLRTRQLYVDGQRAQVAQGPLPVKLTRTGSGYTASSDALDHWSDPAQIEFVYTSGPSNWTQARCRVAVISGTAITMDQPCWGNTTLRPTPGTALYKSGFGQPLQAAPLATDAYQLLTRPGQWYLNDLTHRLYYIPRAGQRMTTATVIAPRLQTLVAGTGTPARPVHDIEFKGITFSYATWLEPDTPDGFSDFQAGTYLTGPGAYRLQGACDSPRSTCPYAAYPQMAGNVAFRYDRRLSFAGDTFEHLGAVGLALGDGSQQDLVAGSLFTDISGSGLDIGGVDQPQAQGGQLTSGNQVLDNYFHGIAAEYLGGPAIFVPYAQYTTIAHNQIDDVPYSGIDVGWGGWLERWPYLGPLSNYSRGNVISGNLIFDEMKVLVDGGGIYINGIQGNSMANAGLIEGNVVLEQHNPSWAIYTDNGTQFMRLRDNVVYDALYVPLAPHYLPGVSPYFSFGGCGGGPISFDGNYSVQSNPAAGLLSALPACGAHPLQGVTVRANHVISSLKQVPPRLLRNAGLTARYQAQLSPAPVPSPLPPYTQWPPAP
ncbi:MAG: right-handed parallel beta-helix repeat-containing protein [Streptosporangiales bacterium]